VWTGKVELRSAGWTFEAIVQTGVDRLAQDLIESGLLSSGSMPTAELHPAP
jgi:hypothetical protein